MKIKIITIGLVIAVTIFLLLKLHYPSNQLPLISHEEASLTNKNSDLEVRKRQNNATQLTSDASTNYNSQPDLSVNTTNMSPDRQARWEKMKEEWRTPIAFYGKVVDENTNAVAGAIINFGWTDLSPEGYEVTSPIRAS